MGLVVAVHGGDDNVFKWNILLHKIFLQPSARICNIAALAHYLTWDALGVLNRLKSIKV